jgi:uncharacterized protein (TIGR03435 family)
MRQGLLDYFHLTARRENRLVDVYVVSALPDRRPPASEDAAHEGGRSSGMEVGSVGENPEEMLDGMKPQSVGAVRSVSLEGTADEFCHMLEGALDLPVVNETGLEGEFKFQIESNESSENDFLERLRDQLGIVIAPAQRNVEMLVFELR